MTPEEMQAELEKLREENKSLTAARDGLLRDKQKWKDQGKSVEERFADMEAAHAQELANLKATHEAEKRALQTAHTAALSQATAARDSYVIGSDLKGALAAAGVIPALQPAVEALMKARGAKVIEKEGSLVAVIGDKPALDYLKEWSASDEGKHFVGAANTGGGAPPNNGGKPPAGGVNPWAKATLNKTQQAKIQHENPDLAAKLKAEAQAA